MNVRAGFLESRAVVLCTRSVLDPNILILSSGKVSYSSSSYLKYTEIPASYVMWHVNAADLLSYRHCSYPVSGCDYFCWTRKGYNNEVFLSECMVYYKFSGYTWNTSQSC